MSYMSTSLSKTHKKNEEWIEESQAGGGWAGEEDEGGRVEREKGKEEKQEEEISAQYCHWLVDSL